MRNNAVRKMNLIPALSGSAGCDLPGVVWLFTSALLGGMGLKRR
ncbi:MULTISPECIES: hypothetical protein [Methylomonas]|nr:hypothetical protein [Methylomonas rhizoryzae]